MRFLSDRRSVILLLLLLGAMILWNICKKRIILGRDCEFFEVADLGSSLVDRWLELCWCIGTQFHEDSLEPSDTELVLVVIFVGWFWFRARVDSDFFWHVIDCVGRAYIGILLKTAHINWPNYYFLFSFLSLSNVLYIHPAPTCQLGKSLPATPAQTRIVTQAYGQVVNVTRGFS